MDDIRPPAQLETIYAPNLVLFRTLYCSSGGEETGFPATVH